LYSIKIGGKTFIPSDPRTIEFEMIELADFISNKRKWWSKYNKYFLKRTEKLTEKQISITYKVFIAWYIHHKLVVIHPFTDGNGRMARLIMCIILGAQGLAEITYPVLINSIINKNKVQYLNALNKTDREDYFSGVEYMMNVLISAYEETVKKGEMIKKEIKKAG
jgi:Fic family protein